MTTRGERIAFLEALVGHTGDDCITWPYSRPSHGYGQVHWDGRTQTASRVMCILAHGEPPDRSRHASHSCGNGHMGCVNPRHLSWKTPSENAADKRIHGTDNSGSKNFDTKLPDELIEQILEAIALGFKYREIAEEVGVSNAYISAIKTGKIRTLKQNLKWFRWNSDRYLGARVEREQGASV